MTPEEETRILVDVGVLKEQTKTLTEICNKMDLVIDKILENEDKWIQKRIYDDMEKRKTETSDEIKDINDKIAEVKKELTDKLESSENKIMNEIRSIRTEFINQRKTEKESISKLLEWKYMIVGGIITFGWIITHLDIAKLFK